MLAHIAKWLRFALGLLYNSGEIILGEHGMRKKAADIMRSSKPLAIAAAVAAVAAVAMADRRQDIARTLFNRDALVRAVEAASRRIPERFADREALLSEIAAAKSAEEMDAVSRKVFFRLPELAEVDEMLLVRRTGAHNLGLPANWQGNTSIPSHGYKNAIVRVRLDPAAESRERIVRESTDFLGDIDLSFDAKRIAFSTRSHASGGWCIAEQDLDGGEMRELSPVDTPGVHYYNPIYLPRGEMMCVGTVGFQGVPCVSGTDNVGSLLLRHADGRFRRLTFDQDENWYPVLTEQGRILFLRWEYADSAHYFARVLMTMNPDGTDQQEFYGSNSYWPNSLFYARPVPGSSTRFMGIVSGHHGYRRMGQLVLFDAAKGRVETSGAVQTLPGWGRPVENVCRDELGNHVCKSQRFLHPWPLSGEGALVAMQDGRVGGQWFVAYVDVYDNQYPLYVAPGSPEHALQPLPIRSRREPMVHVSRVDESKTNCLVNIVSVYNGPGLKGVPRGTVKKLRVYNFEYTPVSWKGRNCGGHYVIGMEGPWDPRVVIGEVDVEEDGSAMFECPANTPIAIQPLDRDGRHLQEMRSWFAGMPGETLSCVGCHERQSVASGPPVRSTASLKKPQRIRPWRGPRRGFSFERETVNVIERRCSACHDGADDKLTSMGTRRPKFNGNPRETYNNLHPYVRRNGPEGDYHLLTPLEFHASTSPLVQMLEKGHHGVRLDDEEWDRLNWWMNLNVPFYGTWTETRQPHPEVISLRRKYERMFSNIDFDPEAVVNPYKKAEFVAPDPKLKAEDEERAERERAGKNTDGGEASPDVMPLLLGNGRTISLRRVPAGDGLPEFWIGEKEVTQADMRAFDPAFDNGVYDMHYKDQVKRGYYMDMDSEFSNPRAGDYPAIRVSHEQATAFCRWLSDKAGKEVSLPTEAEWERACRAGSHEPFFYGGYDADWGVFANLAGSNRCELAVSGVNPTPIRNPPRHLDWELRDARFDDGFLFLAPVGSLRPNAWGIYDMHGNASEWTSTDGPEGRAVVKGGSWNSVPTAATASWRWSYPKWMRPYDVGFRVVVRGQ